MRIDIVVFASIETPHIYFCGDNRYFIPALSKESAYQIIASLWEGRYLKTSDEVTVLRLKVARSNLPDQTSQSVESFVQEVSGSLKMEIFRG